MSDFCMPFLGADMEGGKLVEWLKQPGDPVHHGEIIAVVETEKGAIEIEVFEDGTVQDITAQLGEYRDVGEVLAHIVTSADKAGKTVSPAHISQKKGEAQTPDMAPRKRPRISPAALRQAERLGLDLTKIRGTGHNGAITMADVERSAAQADKEEKTERQPTSPTKGIDIARMRTAIAAAMARSKREIPHYYVSATVDVTVMTDWLSARNEVAPIAERVLPIVPLLKAAARTLEQVSALNGTWGSEDGNGFHESADINIGVAIALRGGGLVAPAILGTDGLSIDELMAKLRDLSGRVRNGAMRGSELTGSTFTVTSVGDGNVESMVPIIYPPQVAILGIGSISERPWVVDGAVRPRRLVTATLAGDHRASDGRVGARFLEIFDRLLQEPDAL
jgi:pyruvate dehydrogenase E2 component (dihydrolipoyllysine-residue acetyltransferase)